MAVTVPLFSRSVCNNHLTIIQLTIIWRQREEGDMNGQGTKIALLFAGGLICAQAQWLNYPAPGHSSDEGWQTELLSQGSARR